jgi:hypothetical protein
MDCFGRRCKIEGSDNDAGGCLFCHMMIVGEERGDSAGR